MEILMAKRITKNENTSLSVADRELIEAVLNNDIAGFLAARDAGGNVNVKHEGYPVLTHASFRGHTAIVEAFLSGEPKPNIDEPDKYKDSALIRAAGNGRYKIVKLLLNANPKANIHFRGNYKDTPLIRASYYFRADTDGGNRLKTIQALLAADPKPDIDAENKNGYTPLYCAVNEGISDVVRLYLYADPRPNVHKRHRRTGHTILSIAEEKGYGEVVDIIKQFMRENDIKTLGPKDENGAVRGVIRLNYKLSQYKT